MANIIFRDGKLFSLFFLRKERLSLLLVSKYFTLFVKGVVHLQAVLLQYLVDAVRPLPKIWSRILNIMGDGFLIDFLQKKTVDAWIRHYVITTGMLFSERVCFESVVKLYVYNLITPLHKFNLLDTSSPASMITMLLFVYFTMFILVILLLTFML